MSCTRWISSTEVATANRRMGGWALETWAVERRWITRMAKVKQQQLRMDCFRYQRRKWYFSNGFCRQNSSVSLRQVWERERERVGVDDCSARLQSKQSPYWQSENVTMYLLKPGIRVWARENCRMCQGGAWNPFFFSFSLRFIFFSLCCFYKV